MDGVALTPETPAWAFLSGLGVLFSFGFVGLVTTWAYLALRLREQALQALDPALWVEDAVGVRWSVEETLDEVLPSVRERSMQMRAALRADLERAGIVCGSVPVLALLGTVLGFFFALERTGQAGLGTADPTAILALMLDSGMDTALATTVAGQALYLLMCLAHAAFISGPAERADLLLSAQMRETER